MVNTGNMTKQPTTAPVFELADTTFPSELSERKQEWFKSVLKVVRLLIFGRSVIKIVFQQTS